ncbi:hypothetical protein [Bacillus seohaeanensis]|uniref:Uncharacterized protein n=1 Tax=Bacillus seohaeanensis TaxID=284580 RepID=A0ABW5RUE6_9BACI
MDKHQKVLEDIINYCSRIIALEDRPDDGMIEVAEKVLKIINKSSE